MSLMFGGFKRYRACRNALNAKVTWESLDQSTQQAVDMHAKALYTGFGQFVDSPDAVSIPEHVHESFEQFSEFEKYTLYSMAMIDSGIPPSTPEPWDKPPRNPFTIRVKPHDLAAASHQFEKHGIKVSIEQ